MDKYIKYDAQPGVVLYIENKGNNRECCYDLDIKDDVTELYLMVFDFCLDDNKKQFKNVSKIVILDTCGDLCLPNQMFPNVKEVISCNNHYTVKQNKLLLNNFSRSLINVFGWNTSDAIDMRGIEVIEDGAFCGCQSRVLENCDTDYIKCKEHAFDGSYFSEQPFNNGVKMAGCIVIALDKTADNVVIPEETRCMAHGLDFSQIKKMTLKTSTFCCDYDGNLPETLIIDGCNDIDSGEIKDITGYGVKHIEVINNKNFVTLDDIVYNKTKTTVVACLAEKTGMVELPEGVTKIEREAFNYCKINSVKFPSTLRLISDNAFADCENLRTIDFGCGLTHVGSSVSWYTFASSGLEKISFPRQVKSIGRGAFYESQLKEITLNEGLEIIEEDSFMMCLGLESISIPKTVIVNGKTYYLPRHMPSKLAARLDELFSFYDVVPEDEIDGLFQKDGMNAIDKSLRQDMMICLYDITKKDCYKQLLKNAKKSIVKRLFENGDEKQLIRFFSFGFFASKSLDNFIKLASEKEMVVLVSYLLEEQKKKSPKKSTKFNI